MNLIVTTPEKLEEIISSSLEKAFKEFYLKKESEKLKKKHHTIKEAAQEFNVSILTIRNYIDKGYLQAFKIGNRVLISNDCLEKALQEVKSLRYKR